MTDLLFYLQSKPWWDSRYSWGHAVAVALVLDAVWYSGYTLHDEYLDEVLA